MAYNNPQLLKILAVIARKPGNNQCADCNMPNPTWASFNLGVFICMNCSGVHRMLGTHITRIRSITLDHWDDTGVQTMAQTGNRLANLYWEAKLPPGQKINANSDENTRTRFIRAKYEQRLWYGQPSAETLEASNQSVQTSAQASHHPDEAGMTREQKIAFRQQRMNGVTSPTSTNSNQSSTQSVRPPQASYTPQPTHQAPVAFSQASNQSHAQPQLRHATSLPQISKHSTMPNRSFNASNSHSTNADDLFAGLTPKVNVQSPLPQSTPQSSPSPPPQQRPKRITGASPWVQRPAGTEPTYAVNPSFNQSNNSSGSAANYYASMASSDHHSTNPIIAPVPVAAAPIDLMNFADPSPPAAAVPSGGFDFLGGDDQSNNHYQSNNQSIGAPGGYDIQNTQQSPDASVAAVDQSMSAFSFFDSNQPQQSNDQSSYQADYQSQYQQSPPPAQQQQQQQQHAPQHTSQQSPQYAQQHQQYEQSPVAATQSEPSGFDFVSDSGADHSNIQSSEPSYGFDFVNDSAPAASSSKPHKSRVIADVFGDLVPESDAALPELEPLGDIQRKASGDGLLASLSAPSHHMPGLGAPIAGQHPPQHAYPPQAYGYPPQATHPAHPSYASPPGPAYGQYPPQAYGQYPPAGPQGYAYPSYASPSATH